MDETEPASLGLGETEDEPKVLGKMEPMALGKTPTALGLGETF